VGSALPTNLTLPPDIPSPGPLPSTITGVLTAHLEDKGGDATKGYDKSYTMTVNLSLKRDQVDESKFTDAGSTWTYTGVDKDWYYDASGMCPIQEDNTVEYSGSGSFTDKNVAKANLRYDNDGWSLDLISAVYDIPGTSTALSPGAPVQGIDCSPLIHEQHVDHSGDCNGKWLTASTFEFNGDCAFPSVGLKGTLTGQP